MSIEEYISARKEGLREVRSLAAEGKDTSLPVLAEIVPALNHLPQVPLGITQVAMERIVGTVTKGRTSAFSPSFLPLLDTDTEFAGKWTQLYDGVIEDGLRQPVTAMEYYNQYYIIEGNKRVSVMRRLGAPFIEADVTRIIPPNEDTPRYRIYQEFLRFYQDTHINFIYFSKENSFKRLCLLTGHKPGEVWSSESVFDIHSCFYRFTQAYETEFGTDDALQPSDAFLVYLEIFGYFDSVNKTPAEIGKDISRVRSEFLVAASGKPAVLLSSPAEDKPTLIQSVLHPLPPVFRCAFLYDSAPEVSGWTYWHELGRDALDNAMGTRVETLRKDKVSPEQAPAVIEQCIKDGYNVIFTASPIFLDACIRESALHPDAKILNCSLLASYHNVRSYYLRIYEAKFILGMIAGAMADNNLIGYIADYPIYGAPASINAFAMGAQLVNPRAQVVLDWSTIPGHNPESALLSQGVEIICGQDIRAPQRESHSFGLYSNKDGKVQNLAMPVLNWSRVYLGVIRSILTGAWFGEGEHNADRAMNYYMGMSTDAVDLVCSEKLPSRLVRLVELMHERIRSGAFLPFVGPLRDQSGTPRIDKDVVLIPQEIVQMDYLAENVIGRIPKIAELSDSAKKLVRLQGIKATEAESEVVP